jgi:hypothetical protein
MRPVTLSDKIKNAPEGSRIRELFYDSSDDDNSRGKESQSKKFPARLQTKPESDCQQYHMELSEQNPNVCTPPVCSPHKEKCLNDNFSSMEEYDEKNSLNSELMNFKIPRISLSPPTVKSRTNVATISSLEALNHTSLDPNTAVIKQPSTSNDVDRKHLNYNKTSKQVDTTESIAKKRKLSKETTAVKKPRKDKVESSEQAVTSKKKPRKDKLESSEQAVTSNKQPRKNLNSSDVDTVIRLEESTLEETALKNKSLENQKPIKKRNLKLESSGASSVERELDQKDSTIKVFTDNSTDSNTAQQQKSPKLTHTNEKPELQIATT